jgi:hypothetical protein
MTMLASLSMTRSRPWHALPAREPRNSEQKILLQKQDDDHHDNDDDDNNNNNNQLKRQQQQQQEQQQQQQQQILSVPNASSDPLSMACARPAQAAMSLL